MNNKIKEIREYISCPQLGDNHYGKWGALRLDQRKKIKDLLDYITNLQEENEIVHKDFEELSQRYFFTKSRIEEAIEDIEFCLNSINQEKELSIDVRTRNEMESCFQVLNETLNTLRGNDND